MKCVFVLFDSLIMKALESYGGTEVKTPNFTRLASKSVQFNTHYVGSLPCMPARRDFHTGRLNFMHRAWGPLEPFDYSWVKILRQQGVYCHMITDHNHYFQEGGLGYHNTFNTWEFVRGQEKDAWKAMVVPPLQRFKAIYDPRHYPSDRDNPHPEHTPHITQVRTQHMINKEWMQAEEEYCTPRCFDKALQFLDTNREHDDWVLWLECFDPHEPFDAPERFRQEYACKIESKILNWPLYGRMQESAEEIDQIRANYAALVAMCDAYLGKMLDYFDSHSMWDDTALILTSDHGFLLSEHQWWGKNRQPYYEEIAHIPLFIAHPHYSQVAGTQRGELTQTPDLMPTLLEMFSSTIPNTVQGKSLLPLLAEQGTPVSTSRLHEAVIFGMFGGPIGVTDGEFVYFHFPEEFDEGNFYEQYLHEYTLMPTHLESYFSEDELKTASLHKGFAFTKNIPLLKIKTTRGNHGCMDADFIANNPLGSALYNIKQDPQQQANITDRPDIIQGMKQHISQILQAHEAPPEFYTAYGLEVPYMI